MTYIGLSPPNTFTKSTSQTFTGNGSTTAFTLQTRVSSPEDLEVFVSNVQQQPTESYTIGSDGVTMTFSEAPPSGTFYVIYRTVAQQSGTDTGASRLGENNTFTGTQTFNSDVSFPDNVKTKFGTGDDLQIYHDGSKSIIHDNGTGQLKVQTSRLAVNASGGSEKLIDATENGAVDLYYDNSKKLETTSAGALITGSLDMNGGEVILDADADTSITADTDDQIDFKVGGTDTVSVVADALKIRSDTATLNFRRVTSEADIARIQYVNANPSLDIGADGKNIRFTNAGSFNENMRLTSSGNLGLGSSNPSARFHIDESASNTYATMRLEGNNRGGQIDMYQGSTIVSQIFTDQSGNIYFGSSGGFGQVAIDSKAYMASENKAFGLRTSTFLTTMADDSTKNIVTNGSGLIIISSYTYGRVAVYKHDYIGGTTLITGDTLYYKTSNTDGKYSLESGSNSFTATLRNRFGGNADFKVMFIGTYQ